MIQPVTGRIEVEQTPMKTSLLSPLLVVKTFFLLSMLMLAGCEKPTPESENLVSDKEIELVSPDPIKILIVGDELLGAPLGRQWKARRNGTVSTINQTEAEFAASGLEIPDDVDLVIYPPKFIGELAETEKINPIPREVWSSEELDKNELLKHFRMSIARFSDRPWAVPLGGSTYSMIYNKDMLQSTGFKPPEFWENTEKRLKKLPTESPKNIPAGIDMPLAEGWAVQTFLARIAPTIRQRGQLSTFFNRDNMTPLVAQPIVVATLEQLKQISTERSLDLDPQKTFELAREGKSNIAMTWPQRLDAEKLDSESANLSIQSLPGVEEWFDYGRNVWNKRNDPDEMHTHLVGFNGLVISVSTKAPNESTALEFLQWLPSKNISLLTLNRSAELGPFRATHLGDVSRWTGEVLSIDVLDEYADVVAECHERPLVLLFPRILKQDRYLKFLDNAIREYLATDDADAKVILQKVAEQWEELTEEIGRDVQVKALRRESGY